MPTPVYIREVGVVELLQCPTLDGIVYNLKDLRT